ncbi:uncharacterized protein ACR2FA_001757 [Aphomia sociella]
MVEKKQNDNMYAVTLCTMSEDRAVECVRNIVDIHRCGICDKSGGLRQRYGCGLAVCVDCANGAQECVQCVTPNLSPCNKPVLDKQLSQKVDNVSQLLITFQEAFNIDVYRRQRLSEQLKVEKEIFPACIQAPMKYCNKRKSLNISFNNKENKQSQNIYSGENTSFQKRLKMDKAQYIEKWLHDSKTNSTRIPFSDLNINDQSITNEQHKLITKSTIVLRKDKLQSQIKKIKVSNNTRNLTKNKLKHNENQSIDKHCKTKVKNNIDNKGKCGIKNKLNKSILHDSKLQYNNDESGIVLDDDFILIDDTPTVIIDKDELALQAVQEAERQEHSDYVSMLKTVDFDNIKNANDISEIVSKSEQLNNLNQVVKVPFYKKGLIYKSCWACKQDMNTRKDNKYNSVDKTNNVSVTIDNDQYVTNIKVSKITDGKVNKNDISVQTDINEIVPIKSVTVLNSANNDIFCKGSQDLFMDEANIYLSQTKDSDIALLKEELSNVDPNRSNSILHGKKSLIIEESDSDLDVGVEQISIDVTAEIHRSCEPKDYGILTEIPHNESGVRKRRAERGLTPTSTDSSDKENYDPNRNKKHGHGKKKLKKSN